MLHRMFQNHDILPHEFYLIDQRHKTFMYASELIVIDEEIAEAERLERERRKKGGA